jgi:hypothetical protein
MISHFKYCFILIPNTILSLLQLLQVLAVPINENIRLLDFYHSPKSPLHVDYM